MGRSKVTQVISRRNSPSSANDQPEALEPSVCELLSPAEQQVQDVRTAIAFPASSSLTPEQAFELEAEDLRQKVYTKNVTQKRFQEFEALLNKPR